MNSHDIGRGRGGVQAALSRVKADLVVVAVSSDRLYPPRLSQEMAQAAASSGPVRMITSDRGHDAFLIEVGQVGKVVRESLSRPHGG
jgi:homoserine O-acetyltransferase